MDIEVIEKDDLKQIRLTVTPTRVTVKFPYKTDTDIKANILAQIPEICEKIEINGRSWRGHFNFKTFCIDMQNESQSKNYKIPFK